MGETSEKLNIIETVGELKKKFGEVTNVNIVHKSRLSSIDKLALFVTQRVGTMGFFLIILGWTFLWIGWNMFAPRELRFDPYPAFVLWLFISNLIQIHLMPLILIGQNIQGQHSEIRSELDYKTNLKKEREIETVLLHLENQQKLMFEILKRIESLEKRK